MTSDLHQRLKIPYDRLDDINGILLDQDMRVVNDFFDVVARYGTPEEINRQAQAARSLPTLLSKIEAETPEYYQDLQ